MPSNAFAVGASVFCQRKLKLADIHPLIAPKRLAC